MGIHSASVDPNMRLAIVLTALGVAIYLADAEPLTVDTNVAINIQNPLRAKSEPMTQRAAARTPDQKGDEEDDADDAEDADADDSEDEADDGTGTGKNMPNLDYVLAGYDIFYGNPSSMSGVDPGFRHAIFRANYSDNKSIGDKKYKVPNGMDILSDVSSKKGTTTITGTESYQDWLGRKASIGYGHETKPFAAKFSASTDYKEVEKHIESEGTIYTVPEVEFSVYTTDINNYEYPEFTEDFIAGVDALTEEYDEKIYQNFINNYGTHFIKRATLGARYGQLQSSKATEPVKKYSIGPPPPAYNESDTAWMDNAWMLMDDDAWVELVTAGPQLIDFKLASLDQLPGLKAYLEVNNKGKVLDNLNKSLGSYSSLLEKKGVVSSCEAPRAGS